MVTAMGGGDLSGGNYECALSGLASSSLELIEVEKALANVDFRLRDVD